MDGRVVSHLIVITPSVFWARAGNGAAASSLPDAARSPAVAAPARRPEKQLLSILTVPPHDPSRRRLLRGGVGARGGAAERLPIGDGGLEVEERHVALGALLEGALVPACVVGVRVWG